MSELSTVLDQAFDTANEEGSPPAFEPIPKGSYVAVITDAKAGPLKSGKGQAVNLVWEIEGGEHAGRLIFDRVIVSHESTQAMKFGRQKLKDVATACGVTDSITDLSVLRNKPCLIFVKIEVDEAGEYPPKNKIGWVKPIAKPTPKASGGKAEFSDEIPF
jgi:hypothetical protein